MAELPTVQRLARQVAETAICEVEYKGKTISEWCELFCKGDLVEVVRCKDCRYLMFSDCYGECKQNHLGIVRPDDYCSYGERKDDERMEKTTL